MTTDEFEALVEGAEESQTLEYKGSCDWSVKTFAKDILAMSNVQDGGFIVVGIEDGTLGRLGLADAQIVTFDLEKMQDQMTEFADPFVVFTRFIVEDRNKKKFVVIRVSEFPEVPVLSRAHKYDIKPGRVYYRTRKKRPASEEVTTSYDMRDVLDRAAVKLGAKRKSQGYKVEAENYTDFYEGELDNL